VRTNGIASAGKGRLVRCRRGGTGSHRPPSAPDGQWPATHTSSTESTAGFGGAEAAGVDRGEFGTGARRRKGGGKKRSPAPQHSSSKGRRRRPCPPHATPVWTHQSPCQGQGWAAGRGRSCSGGAGAVFFCCWVGSGAEGGECGSGVEEEEERGGGGRARALCTRKNCGLCASRPSSQDAFSRRGSRLPPAPALAQAQGPHRPPAPYREGARALTLQRAIERRRWSNGAVFRVWRMLAREPGPLCDAARSDMIGQAGQRAPACAAVSDLQGTVARPALDKENARQTCFRARSPTFGRPSARSVAMASPFLACLEHRAAVPVRSWRPWRAGNCPSLDRKKGRNATRPWRPSRIVSHCAHSILRFPLSSCHSRSNSTSRCAEGAAGGAS
jgi:hypothetical protein